MGLKIKQSIKFIYLSKHYPWIYCHKGAKISIFCSSFTLNNSFRCSYLYFIFWSFLLFLCFHTPKFHYQQRAGLLQWVIWRCKYPGQKIQSYSESHHTCKLPNLTSAPRAWTLSISSSWSVPPPTHTSSLQSSCQGLLQVYLGGVIPPLTVRFY